MAPRQRKAKRSSTTSRLKPRTPEAVTADEQPLRESIFNEIKDRTLLSDLTVPNRIGDWWYYSRMVPGGQYPVFYRYRPQRGDEVVRYTPPTVTPGEVLEGEVVILDCNEYAKDMEFFSLVASSRPVAANC